MSDSAPPALGPDTLFAPARLAELEQLPRREAQLRRIGRLAELKADSLAVWLGPGVGPSALLAKRYGCRTIVVDKDPAALVAAAVEAGRLGVGKLLSVHEGDPLAPWLPHEARGAKLLVAQGLAAAVGFDSAALALRPWLARNGLLALYQRAWITPAVPAEVKGYWEPRAVGEIRTVRATLERFVALGFESMTCELAPARAWDEYFERLEAQLGAEGALDQPESAAGKALVALREAQRIHQGSGARATSIGCFVGRRVEAGSPPRTARYGAQE